MKEPGGKTTDTDETVYLRSRDDARRTVRKLAEQAGRSLLVHSESLDPELFDQQPFLDAITRLVQDHRDAIVLLLVHDARKAVQENIRLIELSRRMSTQVQIRRPAAQHRDYHETLLLADDNGYMQCLLPARYEGTASFDDSGKTCDLKRYFMDAWEHAAPDPETKRLHL